MGHAIVYCTGCGERLLERDVAMGRVLEESGQFWCPACTDRAPATAITYMTAPQETPTVLRGTPVRVAPRPAARPKASAGGALLVAGFVAIVALGGLAAFLLIPGSSGKAPVAPPKPDPVAKTDPLKAAQAEADALDSYRLANSDNAQGIADRARSALAKVQGTPLEERVRQVLREAERTVESKKAERTILDFLAKAKEIADKDPEFLKRLEVKAVYKEARGATDRAQSTSLSLKVIDTEHAYDRTFEEATKKAVQAVAQKCNALLKDDKFDDAMAALDKLPAQFRDTTEGRALETEKRRLLDQKVQRDREARMTITRDFQTATKAMNDADKTADVAKGYRESAELYFKVLADVKNAAKVKEQGLSPAQVNQILNISNYNVACYYSRFTKDVDKAVAYLEESLKTGYNDWKHLDEDTDLDPIRKTEKYKALVAKYRQE